MAHPPRRSVQLPWRSADRIQADVDEELRFELDMRAAELTAQGVPDAEARRRAVAEFGDLERTRRYCAALDREGQRAERRTEWLAELRRDARLAWRGMRRAPVFLLVVLLTLALGIGANVAVFSVVSRMLLERLPYREPERLVRLYGGSPAEPDARGMLSAAEIADLAALPGAFAGVAPFGVHAGYTHVGDAAAEIWQGTRVGTGFFALLGTRALVGRTIDERDTGPDAAPVVVLSHALWQRAFGGDLAAVGRRVALSGTTFTIVGVMPPDFVSPTFQAELWAPLDMAEILRHPASARQARMLSAVGRLAEGTTPAQLRARLALLAERVRAEHPELRDVAPANAVPLRDAMVGQVRPALLVVMGAALLVLVIACVNVAGLFLARATSRRRELAMRAALGAGRGRLVRQLATESAMIGLAGGALGVALAFWGKDVLVGMAGPALPALGEVRIAGGALLFALAVSLLGALAFGLVPALLGTRFDVHRALAESGRGASGGRFRARAGRLLIVGQVALAVVLLVGAGLLGRTLVALERAGVGYDTGPELLTFRVNLSQDRYGDLARETAFFDAFVERLRALPGVVSVGTVGVSPWNGGITRPMSIEGQAATVAVPLEVGLSGVSDGYFAALGIPLRAGRVFGAADRAGAPGVALVSESLARRHWPGASPIGARIRVGRNDSTWREVVGVVGDAREGATVEPMPTAYVPSRQSLWGGAELVVRTTSDVGARPRAEALVPAVREALRELDPTLPLAHPRTLEAVVRASLAGQRLPMQLTSAFATLALVLAALGVYGVMAYAVAAREREFGIRAALGARRAAVLGLVLRQGMAMAVAGTLLGLAVAAAATRLLAGLLVGVAPHDPLTFAAVPVLLLLVCLLACLLPARRATRVEPLEALRTDG